MTNRPPSLSRFIRSGLALAAGAVGVVLAHAEDAPKISTPKEIIGFNIGDDYHMANYTQITTMWKKWETQSDRLKVVSIGNSEEGRPELMCIISSPENMKNLEHYRKISTDLGRARVSDEEAHQLSREGKAVVWVDGGLHAAETVNSQQLAELVYEMISRSDQETMRFLKDVILLAPIANPDGVEVVANWYMRNEDEKKRTFVGLPRLYNKYIGHDNNRDSLMNNMKETTNMDHVLWIDWIPQIMYNTHQSGPEGQIVFIPPYRDPFNYEFDPLLPIGIERVGFAMQERLASQGLAGFATRSSAPYSTWWNGGLRNATFWHNQIGILTEIIGGPTPQEVTLVPEKQLPQGDWAMPIRPQVWHYSQSVHYDVEIAKAALDYGSRNSETLLYNIYRMGRNSIERGSKDFWTITPKRIDALNAAARAMDPSLSGEKTDEDVMSAGRNVNVVPSKLYDTVLHDPAFRDPRGYIISPDDQNDFPTAVKFINVLLKQGLEISKSTASFTVKGKTYPAGSYVIKGDQAFRPVLMDFMEKQDHPNDLAYPGGPPKTPYDITGWTIVKQMGVHADKIYDGFDGPFEPIGYELQKAPVALVSGPATPAGWLVSHKENDSFILTNRLLKAGASVYWLKDEQTADGKGLGTGSVWVSYSDAAKPIIERAAKELGVAAHGLAQKPTGEAMKLKPIRIGLVDEYGGLMPSGWLRWMFEQYEFPFEVVYPQILDAGGLKNSFDVIVFPSQTYATGARANNANMVKAMTKNGGVGMAGNGGGHYDPPAESIPEEYRSMLGNITANKTIPPLKKFIDEGGTIVAIGSSATIGQAMGLPVTDHLVGKAKDGSMKHLAPTKFYIPGSVLEAEFDNTNPLAYGMPKKGYVFFDSSPVFDIDASAQPKTNTVIWFDSKTPLYSGWGLGQQYLDGGKMGAEASIGQGKLVLVSLEATFRGTPHANFKLLFNGLYYGSATTGPIE